MYKNKLILNLFLTSLFFILNLFSIEAQTEIKSLKVYAGSSQDSIPIIDGQKNSLTIEFDVKSVGEPMFNIIFKFCDRDWNPYNNLFLSNTGYNTVFQHQMFYEVLPPQIKEVDFHYKGSFPNDRSSVDFPFSGKWKFYVTESNDTSKVYAVGKFIVVNNLIEVSAKIKNETLEKIYFPTDLGRIFQLDLELNLPENYFPSNVQGIEIIENQKIEYPYYVDRKGNSDLRAYYWNGSNKFSFMSKEIRPGNSYRQVDLRNTTINMAKQVYAQFDGVETSRFFVSPGKDLHGGSLVAKYSDQFATYLDVTFRLRPPAEINSKIFLVGSFNNWQVLPEYEMQNSGGLFTTTVQIKRGIYDYQYVTADLNDGKISNIDWYILEGNNWNTKNYYSIFLWYSEPDKGGYDRIIGYQQIMSN
ncbi:MAG: glycogen-binding domain-containing protein [Ignavibacteriales bacterium]|nr:glycogen-binding domain-containing protein [Ignavibacteriales bacterium]